MIVLKDNEVGKGLNVGVRTLTIGFRFFCSRFSENVTAVTLVYVARRFAALAPRSLCQRS